MGREVSGAADEMAKARARTAKERGVEVRGSKAMTAAKKWADETKEFKTSLNNPTNVKWKNYTVLRVFTRRYILLIFIFNRLIPWV